MSRARVEGILKSNSQFKLGRGTDSAQLLKLRRRQFSLNRASWNTAILQQICVCARDILRNNSEELILFLLFCKTSRNLATKEMVCCVFSPS